MLDKMKEIRVLSPEVANQIAAGEVVERPSSVVKELLENAVDAGATSITVEIREGGTKEIRVSDNGCGIPSSQLERAFLRHATSKIRGTEDLGNITSLGFRGEALAAIASVSRIQVTSGTHSSAFGHSITLEGGVLTQSEEVGGMQGTTMVVRDIFFNTPARKKFMKTVRSEGSHIYGLVQEVALSQPQIAIRFIRDEKEEMKTLGDGKLESAVFHVLGKNIAAGLREVFLQDCDNRVWGFISLPSCCRASRNYQHFFVNGRYIKSTTISAALDEGYRNQKMVGRFPSAVLHLRLNYEDVDVNVHPAKTEVKFAHEKEVFRLIHRCVVNGLKPYTDIQEVTFDKSNTNRISSSLENPVDNLLIPESTTASPLEEERPTSRSVLLPSKAEDRGEETGSTLPDASFYTKGERVQSPLQQMVFLEEAGLATPYVSTDEPVVKKTILPQIDTNFADISLTSQEEEGDFCVESPKEQSLSMPEGSVQYEEVLIEDFDDSSWKVVGEFFSTYIAVEVGDKILLVDKHAAHERVNFDRLQAQNYTPMPQTLLKPVVVHLAPKELTILLENLPLLESFSFEVEEFSKNSVIVRQAPHDIYEDKIAETLVDLAEKLLQGDSPDPRSARDHLLHSMACKGAIRAGDRTPEEEHQALAQIIMEDQVRHCPHGRPIVASLSKQELEKKFRRLL